ncbi:AraC family transcriptional regulator [Ilyomonas limi]|nr:AraC family transcriptional regulator [Ilyomonas limi]
MKPAFESLSAFKLHSFLVRKFEEKSFSAPYHFHPEYELTFILSGSGKRYVGANMNDFYPGDFVLLGANLPHCWKTEQTMEQENSSSIVVQFKKEFLGTDFFSKPEMAGVLQLLQKSSNGIQFTGNAALYKKKMQQLYGEKNSCRKTILLLDLLHELSITKKYQLLEKQHNQTALSPAEQQRIHIAMAYIVEHFKSDISLTAAASAVNMAPQSFCKYFKKLTRKTFMEAVTDYRIDYAAQQLIHTSHSISQIGFDSGFNDISNFHKTFKTRMQLSPLSYRNTFLQKLNE